ncbi:astacin-like metalloprotease toxin 5 isoform X2 [Oncorhynchus keta]|uniref:astacin-like metalloprotease toxin 5 isoform X3 n=1 Tax=Oncorhynchus keta TaxID=8018 RepID=UPI00227AE9BA|nr:astacin-like metalloprotease toxin 5 isoform X3 [Oncorhynchus keta]XP_052381505.1 astacin-like metalloprotease toxin 5 isoform X2 [Oncorhynchus keta]
MVWLLILWVVQVGSVPIANFTNATTSNATFPATVDNSKNPINNSTNVTFSATGSTASTGPRRRQNDWYKTPETREEDLQFDLAIMEGDILVSEDRLAVKSLWPENEGVTSIPYKINGDLVDRKETMLAAFKMISDQTCILFHEYTNEINYIEFISGSGCASYVGFQGGAQPLYFGRACNVGNLCHELMHALGLHHEHTRPDRDQYITIQWDNVVSGKEDNFKVKEGDTQDLPYDYDSIMHYGTFLLAVITSHQTGTPLLTPRRVESRLDREIT